MNTHTPTGDGAGALPPWLPDEATLTRLANEFFGNMPAREPEDELSEESVRSARRPQSSAGSGGYLGPVVSSPEAPERCQPGYLPPDPLAQFHRATSVVANPGVTGPLPPALTVPGLSAPSAAAISAVAGERQLERTFEVPGVGQLGGPSFYFIEEQLPAAHRASTSGPHSPSPREAYPAFHIDAVRRDFPILSERVHGRQLVWLDNGATTQKPQVVIDRMAHFYSHENSNIHRSAHSLAARSSDAYENARSTVADFLGAASAGNIVFTRGTTEAINLVAQSWGPQHLGPEDEIVISHLEHHANIVPWQQLAAKTGARLKVIPVDDDGQVLLDAYADLLSERTKLVSISHVSNVLGTIVPVKEVIDAGHRVGAKVLVDGAQAVAHMVVDVQALDADFYVFSGHKIFAPTGIGALYGKSELLEEMPPWQGGGNMISDVTLERTIYQRPPAKFEAGTGNIAGAVGLGAALEYLNRLGRPVIERYEHELLNYAISEIRSVPGLRLIGTAPDKASVLTFVLEGYRPEDVGSALDQEAIAVRAGHHCAQPILRRYGLESAVRPSLAMYNTYAEVDLLVAALRRLAADAGNRR
ncbi:MAG: family 2A encapsulin nanocompartment cargo protein cysteine desulfurase [Acidimicrobiales bacterium]|jgi:cysteine desulfurase/selenocysteine lyase